MKIGFIGLGIMGESMAENIVKKSGKEVYVFDFNQSKIDQLVEAGAIAAGSSKEVAEKTDVVITMVPKSEHVKAVHESLYDAVKENQIFIDMSTIEPAVSKQLAEEIHKRGADMIDAPVVKSKPAAISGTLGIYVGGKIETFEKVKDILSCMGSNVIHMGENGTGLVMKMCHNMMVAQIQNGVNETMALAESNGINWEQFATAISYGGGQNFYLDTKASAIGNRDFTTAFSVQNMYKDVHIALSMAKEAGLDFPGMELVTNIYDRAMEEGFGQEDFSATYKVVKKEMAEMR
jgi:3-hydroxyisobutyrate dehydrogenase